MVNWFSPRHLLVALTIAAFHQLSTTQFSPATSPQPFSSPPTTQSPLHNAIFTIPPPPPKPRSTIAPPRRKTRPTVPAPSPDTRSTAPAPSPNTKSTAPAPSPDTRSADPASPPDIRSTAPAALSSYRPTKESPPPQQTPSSAPTVQPPRPSRSGIPPRIAPLSPAPLPPVETEQDDPQEQLVRKVVEALTNAGNFRGWASLLAALNLSRLPFDCTFFVPADEAMSHIPAALPGGAYMSFDPFIMPYHIVPVRLCFEELLLFETGYQLPTLLPSNFIVITNNSRSNFTVDSTLITNPDVYQTSGLCVHGIKNLLDYSVFGEGLFSLPAPVPPTPMTPKTVDPPESPMYEDVQKSTAALYTILPAWYMLAFSIGILIIVRGLPKPILFTALYFLFWVYFQLWVIALFSQNL